MYHLRRFHGSRFDRVNAFIDSLAGHITSYVNLIGSATLPIPEVCAIEGLPGTACRVEGHPDDRFFPATDPIDQAEAVINDRIHLLFGVDSSYEVSGQPHSATQANLAVFRALLGESGTTVAALTPADGGHISHSLGLPSGCEVVPIPLSTDGIDYDALDAAVERRRPAMIIAGGTSYTRGVDYARLRRAADTVGAHLHADLAHTAPFVASGRNPPVFPHVDSATFDLSKNLRGPRGGVLVYKARDAKRVRRAIFPSLQSSPNQNAVMAKAACLSYWTAEQLADFADSMIRIARDLTSQISGCIGPPVFSGTDTHLALFDVSSIRLTGIEAERLLEGSRILVNRNQVPGDERPPTDPSGIRLGSTVPAILGYSDDDVSILADAVCCCLEGGDCRAAVEYLLQRYHRDLVSTSSEPTS